MKRLRMESRGAVNPIYVLVVVIIMVVAGIGLLAVSGNAEEDGLQASMTIYVDPQEDEDAATMAGTVNGNALSWSEQMMLSWWDDEVRITKMQEIPHDPGDTPVDYTKTAGPLSKTSSYHVWADVDVKVVKTTSNIAKCNYLKVSCIGYPVYSGATWKWALTHGGENNVTKEQSSATIGSVYTFDFANDGKAFDRVADLNKNVKQNIKGTNIDGMMIRCFIYAGITATTGETFEIYKCITIRISVSSWSGAQMALRIIDIDN